jgi:hypothetical protein
MTPQQEEFLRGKPTNPPDHKPVTRQENGQAGIQVNKHVNIQTSAAMVTFSVRLTADRVNRIKQAALRRKMAGLPFSSQQDIIQAAVDRWLEEND